MGLSGQPALTVETVSGGTVMPVSPAPRPRLRHAFRFGVFDDGGRIVRGSLLFRSYGQMGFAADFATAAHSDAREVIFAGHLSQHFGHFLLESLSRLWHVRRHPHLPIVWACRAEPAAPTLGTWQRQILDVLDVHNEVLLLTEPTRFASVHVPEAGYRVQDIFSPEQAAFLAAYPARRRDPELRLWLSRAGLDPEYGSIHAPRLDRLLAGHGWTVIQPEQLPIIDQLELLARATRVAGEEGSAFHLLALLADVGGLEVDIIYRDPERPVERQNGNYQTIAAVRGLRQRLHRVPEERVLAVHRGHVRKLATTMAGHLEIAGVPRPGEPSSPVAPRPLARLVDDVSKRLAARSYLEVGSGAQGLYPDVDVPARHVVKPAFEIDPRTVEAAGLQLFEMPPDEFFTYLADPSQAYDLIVLDEPASDEEALHWLAASRRHAGPSTVWLLRAALGTGPPPIVVKGGAFEGLRSDVVMSDEGPVTVLSGPSVPRDRIARSTGFG